MAFPNNKAHRVSRRKLGKGQHVQLPALSCTVSVNLASTASTATSYGIVVLTFNLAPIVNGPLDIKPAGFTFASQSQVSPTVFNLTYSPLPGSASSTVTYAGIAAGSSLANTQLGGGFLGIAAGTL